MLKCIELDEKLKSMDQEITVNPQFVQKVSVLLQNSALVMAIITDVLCSCKIYDSTMRIIDKKK